MDPESKKLLEETFELSKDNNNMLHSMRRSQRIANIMSFIYWIFIIGSAVGAFYLLQPYFNQVMDMYNNANSVLKNVKQFGS